MNGTYWQQTTADEQTPPVIYPTQPERLVARPTWRMRVALREIEALAGEIIEHYAGRASSFIYLRLHKIAHLAADALVPEAPPVADDFDLPGQVASIRPGCPKCGTLLSGNVFCLDHQTTCLSCKCIWLLSEDLLRVVGQVRIDGYPQPWDTGPRCPDCGYVVSGDTCTICHPRDERERQLAAALGHAEEGRT